MKTKILIPLYFALSFCFEVYAEGEQEVKRGLFPFMAFIYYPDETVVDDSGARFLRGAVLIQPNWLITSAVGPNEVANTPNAFPAKTLLARVGAISIDSNFTLNEDEDEQEREVIRIVRPYNYSATQWWHTDISLMKTLLPFNMTSAVAATMLGNRPGYIEKTCTVLVYAKSDGNRTEDRNLMQLTVELLPPSVENCGNHFVGQTMTCAADSDESKNAIYHPNFCQGNSGSPLICESDVIGIQTYIDNNCKQPHLYQLLSAWDNFITCGTEDKCHEEHCSKTCDVVNKDQPELESDPSTAADTNIIKESEPITLEDDSQPIASSMAPQEQTTLDQTTIDQPPSTTIEILMTNEPTTVFRTSVKEEPSETTPWPKEKDPDTRKQLVDAELEDTSITTEVEAQQEVDKVRRRNSGQTNILNSYSFGYFIMICLISI